MITLTEEREIIAREQHACKWCDEPIFPGNQYVRWTQFDSSFAYKSAYNIGVHPECFDAMLEVGGADDFFNNDNPRGCNCDFDPQCKRCLERYNHEGTHSQETNSCTASEGH